MLTSVIVTADDLGLDPEINRGIVDAFRNGIVSCAALLMNAPFTDEGILIAKDNPDLEVGIHLSIVEGYSLRGVKSTITCETNYFENGVCLKKDWKEFIKSYLKGNIDFRELEDELELQILKFRNHFNTIPFLNSTQHLHLLPGVWRIVFSLCKKYDVKAVRLPRMTWPNKFWLNKKLPYLIPFNILGSFSRNNLLQSYIKCTDDIIGLQYSGRTNTFKLLFILKNIRRKNIEIIMHPGYHSEYLSRQLPDSYTNFFWEEELKAVKSIEVKNFLTNNRIQLVKFSDL